MPTTTRYYSKATRQFHTEDAPKFDIYDRELPCRGKSQGHDACIATVTYAGEARERVRLLNNLHAFREALEFYSRGNADQGQRATEALKIEEFQ